jgi:hypothetical protein
MPFHAIIEMAQQLTSRITVCTFFIGQPNDSFGSFPVNILRILGDGGLGTET